MTNTAKLLAPCLLLLALAGVAAADDECVRLVQPVAPTTYGRGTHLRLFAPPSTAGAWYVVVSRDGASPGRVELDGRVVVGPRELAGPTNRHVRVPVTVRAASALRVVVPGNTRLTVSVVGVVPEASLPPGVGRRAGRATLFQRAFHPVGPQPLETTVTVPAGVAAEGLFDLHVRAGQPRPLLGFLAWNGEEVLGVLPILPGLTAADGPVRVQTTNVLRTTVVGLPPSSVIVTLDGTVVDEVAPVATWTAPTSGATLAGAAPLRVTFADALTGVASVRVTLNGVDVTSAFAVDGAQATSTLAQLPPALLQASNTLRAVVRDGACNETVEAVTFSAGGGGGTTPPVVAQPADLVVEQASPAGAVATFVVTATDDQDPAPVVTCTPPSGALFAPGVTTVTCTARDAAGNVSAPVTFTVTVRDTTAPTLAQPADLVVEQTSPAGALVTYAAPLASDAADPAPVVTCTPASGALFAPGVTTVTCTARDAAGNVSAPVTFTVTVRDTTAPTLAQPADLVVEQTSPAGALVTYAAPAASDAADPAPVVTCTPASGALFAPGVTTVTCTARDAAGNVSAPVTFTVTVRDTTAPSLVLEPADAATVSTTTVLVRATFTDGGAGLDPASLVLTVDGLDRTAELARGPTSASATLVLAGGPHVVTAFVRDLAGNGQAASSSFRVEDVAIHHLELTIGPPLAPRAAPDEDALLAALPAPADLRALDGSGNDLARPDEGRAGSKLLRGLPAAYGDGVASPAGASRPSARAVSNGLHAQAASVPNPLGATDLLWIWGQFLTHDLSLTPTATPAEPLPIPVAAGDPLGTPYGTGYGSSSYLPFSRSAYDPASSPREQVNAVTAWLDGSMVYGSDPARAAALRLNDGTGRLRTSAGDLLPYNTDGLPNRPTAAAPTFFLAGDVRANETVPLTALHTLFVREHNRLALAFAARHPGASDEELYQAARRVVGAELQAITYGEFLPALLGDGALAPYAGYDPDLQVGIDNAFATAAFRAVGHTLVSPRLLRLDAAGQPIAAGPLALRDAFFAPARLDEGGLEPLLRGAARQLCQELDPFVVDDVRNYLFGAPGAGGLDLAALDLQRGRDHGLPSYVEARAALGLAPRATFAEVSSDPLVQTRLAQVYGTVEAVDLLAGALAEDPVPGAQVGELLRLLLARQFALLRDGDRLFYANAFGGAARAALEQTRLADVIRRNTNVGAELPDDVFRGPLLPFTENDLTVRAVTASGETVPGFTGFVTVSVSDGKPPLDGLLLELTAADQGQVTVPDVAFFQTLGPLTVTARTLVLAPGDPEVSGALQLDVGLVQPVLFPELPASVAAGAELTLQGLSFTGQLVEIVVDGQLVATEVAGPGGAYTASLRLAPGAHQVSVRAIDPATGVLVSSRTFTVVQAAPPATGLEVEPASLTLAVGQARPLVVRQRFADRTTRDVTAQCTFVVTDPARASASATGLVAGLAVGGTTVTVGLDGASTVVPVTVGPPVLVETSPGPFATGVAVTRETVLRFSAPLQPASVTASAVRAEHAGAPLAGTLHLSGDRRTVTLFYAPALPPSARVRVTVDGGLLRDDAGNQVDVDKDGAPGGVVAIDFDTLSVTVIPGTVAYGRVFGSALQYTAGTPPPGYPPGAGPVASVNVPLVGAKISVVGAEDTLVCFTDEHGNFRLDPSPAGTFFVHVELEEPGVSTYRDLGRPWTTLAGEETSVGDVYLPLIDDDAFTPVSDTAETVVTFAPDVLSQFPHLQGTQLLVPAGALYSTTGSTAPRRVGLAPVAPDRLPAPLPPGLAFSVVFSIQTQGGEDFDVPVPVRFPNSDGLAPGSKTALWSFNHDTGQWEVVGSMTVSADGLWVESDPGVGILAPGWHGLQPGTNGTGGPPARPAPKSPRSPCNPTAPQEPNGCPNCTCQAPSIAKHPRGSSVLLHSGEESLSRTDLVLPGRGDLSFVLERRYRSRLSYDGPLGHAWDFSLNEQLFVDPNGDVTRVNGSSHVDRWRRSSGGTFVPPPGYFSVLSQRPDGVYVLRETNGLERHYASDGRLAAHIDRFGNRMDFVQDEFGDLDLVIDPYGREIDFTFQEFAGGKRRLTRVRDYTGREWLYGYDEHGDLTTVRHPIVVGTSTGNDFPAGSSERYGYTSGFANEELNHNLLTVTSPEEVAHGGPPSLVLTYGTNSADPLVFDRVLTRTEGGINASGVPAGGTTTFTYSRMNEGVSPGDKTLPRKRAHILMPTGNVRTSYVNEDDQHILDRHYTRGLRPGEPEYFEERQYFNSDNRLVRKVLPAGNEVRYTYGTGSRAAQETVVEARFVAGPRGADGLGAPAEDLVTTYTYEPLYQQVHSVTDSRGNSPSYTPPLGERSNGRYTSRVVYDYQEGTGPVPVAEALGIDLSGVPRGLGDVNGDGRTDQVTGNPIRTIAPSVELEPGSAEAAALGTTTQTIVSDTWWNDRGQVVRTVDPVGTVTTLGYYPEDDPDGDGQRTHTMWTTVSSAPTGYLATVTADAAVSPRRTFQGPLAELTASFHYDRVGNVVATTNPRGVRTELELNAWNQVVVATRGADVAQAIASGQLLTGEGAKRYRARSYYDTNGRAVRSEVENRDGTTEGVGAWVESSVVYDILGSPLEVTAELDATTRLTTRMRYDATRHLIETLAPEGERATITRDERDLPFLITRGAGTPFASTVQLDYDANENLIHTLDAEDTDGDGEREGSLRILDGFDRTIEARDALGNRALTSYDVASQVVRTQVLAHPPGDPTGSAVPYADVRLSHDELGRVFRTDAALFVTPGFTAMRPIALHDQDGDGLVTAHVERDALSRVTRVLEDDGQPSFASFDAVSRLLETRDVLGNRQLREYDKNGNATRVTSIEVASNGIVPAEQFVTRMVYDQLDRLVRATDSAGQTSRFSYDSRDLLVLRSDPMGVPTADPLALFPGAINGPGNTCRYVHDGLGRMVRQVCDLRVGGTGAGPIDTSNPRNPDGQISLGYVFDGNSRLIGIVDDNGNRTSFGYDALSRKTSHTYADGTGYAFTYDRDDNIRTVIDPNGSVVTKTYDALNRMLACAIARGPGVVGTTLETYSYDGVSRLVRATDDNGSVAATQACEWTYDSLGRLLEERQNSKAISSTYTGDGKRASVTYPGGRRIDRTFDALDRIVDLKDGPQTIATSDWIGPGMRELRRQNGNGTKLTFLNDAGNADVGFDAVQRLVRLRVLGAGGAPIVDREYSYNRASQRTSERRNDDFGLTDTYTYDSAYRIVASAYDQAGLPGAVARELTNVSYVMDGVGNRRDVAKQTSVGLTAESYSVNAVNHYVTVAGLARDHDDNGNLTDDGTRLLAFDYKNRLVAVARKADLGPVAFYGYLPDGRRSRKQVFDPGTGSLLSDTRFLSDGAQEVEEQGWTSGVTTTTYVWSPVYVDELVSYTNSAGTFYAHQDARCDVVAITNAAGSVVERRRYDDFGKEEIRSPIGQVLSTSPSGCEYGFQGRRLDPETGLVFFRARYYSPETGRFVQRDPVWDAGNVGGQYTFCGNGPIGRRDPSGLLSPGPVVEAIASSRMARSIVGAALRNPVTAVIAVSAVVIASAVEAGVEARAAVEGARQTWRQLGELNARWAAEKAAMAEATRRAEEAAFWEAVKRAPKPVRAPVRPPQPVRVPRARPVPRPCPDVPDVKPRTRTRPEEDDQPPPMRYFAHGTSLEHAESIAANGLSQAQAQQYAHGGTANQPGSFHTHELGPPTNPGIGMQLAYEWGAREDPKPVVLIMGVPAALVEELQAVEEVTIEPTPGAESYPEVPPQVVFHPGGYPALNAPGATTWQIVDPHHAERE